MRRQSVVKDGGRLGETGMVRGRAGNAGLSQRRLVKKIIIIKCI